MSWFSRRRARPSSLPVPAGPAAAGPLAAASLAAAPLAAGPSARAPSAAGLVLLVGLFLGCLPASPASAQPVPAQAAPAPGYPDKPIRLIVPFPPGGGVDLYARTVQPALQQRLGQPVVIDNRPGASGMIGAEMAAKAAPDGYTLLVGNIAVFAMNSATYRKVSYDPMKDFVPILQTVLVPYVLVAHPSVAAGSVPELLAYAKAHPGKLAYASSGAGSAQHMAAELFKSKTGTELTHIPYKGVGALVTDLIAGHVQLAFADQASMMPHVKAGKLKLIAVAGPKRLAGLPEVPAIAETAGLDGFEIAGWQGVAGPAGLPGAIAGQLNRAFNDVQAQPEVRQRFIEAGLVPVGGTAEDFRRYIERELVQWTRVARDVGAVAD